MAALEMGSYLVHTREGVPMIKRIILEDIEEARRHGHPDRALKLKFSAKTFRENPSEEPGRSVRKSELSQ